MEANTLFDVRRSPLVVKRGREVLRIDKDDRLQCWIVSPKPWVLDVHVIAKRTAVHFKDRSTCQGCGVDAPLKEYSYLLIAEGSPLRTAFVQFTPIGIGNLLRQAPDPDNLTGLEVVIQREQKKIRSPLRSDILNKPAVRFTDVQDENPVPTLLRLWNVRLTTEQLTRLMDEMN